MEFFQSLTNMSIFTTNHHYQFHHHYKVSDLWAVLYIHRVAAVSVSIFTFHGKKHCLVAGWILSFFWLLRQSWICLSMQFTGTLISNFLIKSSFSVFLWKIVVLHIHESIRNKLVSSFIFLGQKLVPYYCYFWSNSAILFFLVKE